MGRGGRRANAGRPPKALADLRLSGGIRPGRHQSLLKAVPVRSALAVAVDLLPTDGPPVPETACAGLSASGLAFVRAAWSECEGWSASETALLNLAGRSLDDVESAVSGIDRHRAIRVFAAVVAQLGLDKVGGRS